MATRLELEVLEKTAAGVRLDITPSTSVAVSFGIMIIFVGGIYVWGFEFAQRIWNIVTRSTTPPALATQMPRDSGRVIAQRVVSVTSACWVTLLIVYGFSVPITGHRQGHSVLNLIGIRLEFESTVEAGIKGLLLSMAFYSGPLLVLVADTVRDLFEIGVSSLWPRSGAWVAFRNWFAAPISEEICFRGCVCALMLSAGIDNRTVGFTSPFVFGLAHVHHIFFPTKKDGLPVDPLSSRLIKGGVQITYTTIFGWYCCFLFIRTGHLAAPIAAHCFCNTMGLPDFSFNHANHHLHRYRTPLFAIYFAGMALFMQLMYPLTAGFPAVVYWHDKEHH
jgi:prenyl protein peptidase